MAMGITPITSRGQEGKMMHLGDTVRALRMERKMSQTQLAQAAGVARSYISMIESGARTNIGTETLRRVAAALDLSPADMLSRDNTSSSSGEPRELSPEVRQLAERIDALPPGAYERAIALLDSVVRGLHAASEEPDPGSFTGGTQR